MTILKDFEDRTALVTGAGSGIGAACAKALAERGAAKLILVDVNADGLDALDLDCEVERVVGSVADEALWQDLEPRLAGLDHAVVNAGIGAGGPLGEVSFADWRRVMDVNLDGAFLTLAASMRAMKGKGGSAVVVSSTTGVKAIGGIGPYGVSKAAVAHMARIAALDGAAQGIRVNAIAPGGVDTNIWDSSEDFRRSVAAQGREATLKAMASTTPSGRFATPDQIASDILYMLSDAGSNITGHVLVSDGGFTL
ncbi:SDR family NAD(P)-dependent oxidoreductase [Erythrobacter sp. THAF29]|uniref:SDR family NAD(P)-dependent oxidoreductase n=1 Tax=Erythrobacter sp. THAF29 TaxID=2587851 RepID=UPI001267C5FE|nr:SDR family oxidoreductase [Erythrobacter sp. THAF29]QFT77166.1 2,5-dichloro-2,5-cyclohexadiene-1,4-diol dehydrogenase [Erythrobacter sp. THAF29]